MKIASSASCRIIKVCRESNSVSIARAYPPEDGSLSHRPLYAFKPVLVVPRLAASVGTHLLDRRVGGPEWLRHD